MRRAGRLTLWIIGPLLGLLLLAIGVVWVGGNLPAGRRWIERTVASRSHGMVQIQGLAGAFPQSLKIARLQLRDRQGTYAVAENLQARWSPLALLARRLQITRLSVARVQLLRRPVFTSAPGVAPAGRPASGSLEWLRGIRIGQLQLPQVQLDAPLAGTRALLAIGASLHLASLAPAGLMRRARVSFSARRLDGKPGAYRLMARLTPARVRLQLRLDEGPGGLLEHLLHLPVDQGLRLTGDLNGPRQTATSRLLASGAIQADLTGTVNLPRRSSDLSGTVSVPTLQLGGLLAWQQLNARVRWHGTLASGTVQVRVQTRGLRVRGIDCAQARLNVQGRGGMLRITGAFERVRLPGSASRLLGTAPLMLTGEAALNRPTRPVTLALSHPLLQMQLSGQLSPAPQGTLSVRLHRLAPFAALAHQSLHGTAALQVRLSPHGAQRQLAVAAQVQVAPGAGRGLLARLVAPDVHLTASAALTGNGALRIEQARVQASSVQASLSGRIGTGALRLNWTASLARLAALSSRLIGRLDLHGTLGGSRSDLSITASGAGQLGVAGTAAQPVRLTLQAHGLPTRPSGQLSLTGRLQRAPVDLAVALRRPARGGLALTITRGHWKSLSASGQLRLGRSGAGATGGLTLRVSRLADLAPLLGRPLHGTLMARIAGAPAGAPQLLLLQLQAHDAGLAGLQVGRLEVAGSILAPLQAPRLQLALAATAEDRNLAAEVSGSASGPIGALRLTLAVLGQGPILSGARLEAAVLLERHAALVELQRLTAEYRGQALHLLAPGRISFAHGLSLEPLTFGSDGGHLSLSGTLRPALDLTVSAQDLGAPGLAAFNPALHVQGHLDVRAHLTGTLSQPQGELSFQGHDLNLHVASERGIPSATLTGSAHLEGRSAMLDAQLRTSDRRLQLQAKGRMPFGAEAPMDMTLAGQINLALADPVFEARGQNIAGLVRVDARVRGTLATPQASGSVLLMNGDLRDYQRGLHLTRVQARLEGSGAGVQIQSFSARAGAGTISASGGLGLQAGLPLQLHVQAHDATLVSTDLLTMTAGLDVHVQGLARRRLELSGRIDVRHTGVNIPNALPTTVAVLNVRQPGERATPPPPRALSLALNLTVSAPSQVFVRGRGLTAELGGQLHVTGTLADPQIGGGFTLRSGTFNLAGVPLTFTGGRLSFSGTGLHGRLDPTLDFTAASTANGITAMLHVGGYADRPVITLTSSPSLPPDAILARLLFGTDVTRLTGLQIAQIAAALTSLTGVGGGGLNPLSTLQQTLGLDRLAISSTPGAAPGAGSGTGATIEAGRYVTGNIYVGARQSTTGTTQAQVEVDLTRQLRLKTTLATGGGSVQGATPENDPGSSIGLSYQVDF